MVDFVEFVPETCSGVIQSLRELFRDSLMLSFLENKFKAPGDVGLAEYI